MPLLKVHIGSLGAPGDKPKLVKRLREVMVEKLSIDEKIGQVVLYEALPQHREIHDSRDKNFIFMEVLMYPGRTADTKENFMRALVVEAHKILKIGISDINCCLQEVPQENWYGGISHTCAEEIQTKK